MYISAIFDCFDSVVPGLAMYTNTQASLCVKAIKNAITAYSELLRDIIHSNCGSQYTSTKYCKTISHYHIIQRMNRVGERCHDNARCESIWVRMKEELFYGRYSPKQLDQIKQMIWRFFLAIGITAEYALPMVDFLPW